jgi:hypothetical protein
VVAAAFGSVTTARQLRTTALSLPEVEEAAQPGAFVVAGKEFASCKDGQARLRLPADDVDVLLEKHPTARRITRGAVVLGASLPLADIDGHQLNRWVRQAWKHRAPERLVAGAEAAERAEPGGDLPRAIGRPATRALAAAGITTLDGVARLSETELASLHGVGPKAVGILRSALAERG